MIVRRVDAVKTCSSFQGSSACEVIVTVAPEVADPDLSQEAPDKLRSPHSVLRDTQQG